MAGGSDGGGLSAFQAAAIVLGAVSGLAGVAVAAWAAHGAPPELRGGLATAAHFALLHGLALIACAAVDARVGGRRLARLILVCAALAFAAGIALFCGGIVLAARGVSPGTQPAGGTLLLAGWGLFAMAAVAALGRR